MGGRIHVLQHGEHFAYDRSSSAWLLAPSMPTPRHGLGVAVVDDVLYAFGGCHEQLFDLDVVEAYELIDHTAAQSQSKPAPSALEQPPI